MQCYNKLVQISHTFASIFYTPAALRLYTRSVKHYFTYHRLRIFIDFSLSLDRWILHNMTIDKGYVLAIDSPADIFN